MKKILWVILGLSALLLLVRATVGPFHLSRVAVNTPINLESVVAVGILILLILASRRAPGVDGTHLPPWYPVLLVAAATVGAWWWVCSFPFVADDYEHISRALVATPAYLAHLFRVPAGDGFFRPLGATAFGLQAWLWGTNRLAWHAVSIGLHGVNSLLVYRLARSRGVAGWPALAGGLFFLLNGSRPEPVAWIGAQFDLWAALFFLLALLALERRARGGAWWWEATSWGALLLALFSKESAYIFPAVAALMLAVDGLRGRRLLRLAGPPAILTAAMFLYRWSLLRGLGGYRIAGSGQSFFSAVDLLRTPKGLLLRLPAVLLFPLNWSYRLEWWLVVLLAAALAGWWVLTQGRAVRKEIVFGLATALLCALPVHIFLLIDSNMEKSRVLYLPSIGFALVLAASVAGCRGRAVQWATAAILAFQVAALTHNLTIWRSVAELSERTCQDVARKATEGGVVEVSDVPNYIDGVYFLHNGLLKCINWAADGASKVVLEGEDPGATRRLMWDDASRKFVER